MINSQLHTRRKILFVITKSVWGGAQRYVLDLATNLPQSEFEVAVACGLAAEAGSSLKTTRDTLIDKLQKNNIPLFPVRHFQKSINPFNDFFSFFEILLVCFRFQPDIIHVNSSKAGGIAGLAGYVYQFISRHRVRRVFTIHGWAFLEPWRPHWQCILIRFLSRLTVLFYNSVIVISERDSKAAETYNVMSRSKVTLIHNGIKPFEFTPRAIAQQELLGTKHALVIGTVAEWTQNKGLTYLIDAMPTILKEFSETVLCLVGWGELEKNFQFLISNFSARGGSAFGGQLRKNVFLVSKNEAATYLKAFDVFVLPSLKEGLPYTILEAGLAELPVVATRVGGIPDIIEHRTHGFLVDPASPEQLANSVIQLLRNTDLQKQFGHALHERVTQHFLLEAMLKKTITLYTKQID